MKILLIEPRNSLVRPPQALHYIASAVKAAGHVAEIHDESLFSGPSKSYSQILSCDAEAFGLSVYTSPESIPRAVELSMAIKNARGSAVPVIWGGWHPTLYPHDCMRNACVDIVVRGPGEKTACDLLNSFEQHTPLEDVANILFRREDDIVETAQVCADDSTLFPRLDYGLINTAEYIRRHDQGHGRFSYITSRGCFGRCAFCSSRLVDKQRRYRKPMSQCIDELRQIISSHEVRHLVMSDPVAFANGKQADDLIEIVRQTRGEKRLSWRCDARIDVLSRLSEDTFKSLTSSGCTGFAIGIESGADRVLQLMQKDITEAQISKVLTAMAEHGLHDNLFWFMVGFPGETPEEASRTLSLACRVRTSFPRSNIVLTWFKPQLAGEITTGPEGGARMSVGRAYVGAASYYLSASAQRGSLSGLTGILKLLHQKLVFARVCRQVFSFPIEYWISRGRALVKSLFTKSVPRH